MRPLLTLTALTTDDLTTIRDTLTKSLPWTTYDFIRHRPNFFARDRQRVAEELTEPIKPENDLRYRFTSDDTAHGLDVAILAERLPWDSEFFGMETAKLHGIYTLKAPHYDYRLDYRPALAAFLKQARERGIRYLLAPVFAEDLAALRALGAAGFEQITGLNYYHISVQDFTHPERYPSRAATVDDIPSLAATARDEVNPYDRFHSDPFIAKEAADRMMTRWVEASIRDGFADITIVPDVPEPKAFCTVRYHKNKWDAWGMRMGQFVLSAIDRDFKGWYLKCFVEILYHLKEMGVEHAFVSTQITNRAAIRQCEKLGFRYGRTEYTYRLVL